MTDLIDSELGTTDPEEGDDVAPAAPQVDPLVLARKRQAGAEAARRVAEQKANDAAAEIARLKALIPGTASDAEATELGRLQEQLAQAQARADKAESDAQAKLLNTMYPAARAKLPEVTDEVRLAEFEAMLRDDEEPSSPTPQRHNESRTPSGRTGREAEPSYEDVRATFLSTDVPW
jgi:hypothetical protein